MSDGEVPKLQAVLNQAKGYADQLGISVSDFLADAVRVHVTDLKLEAALQLLSEGEAVEVPDIVPTIKLNRHSGWEPVRRWVRSDPAFKPKRTLT